MKAIITASIMLLTLITPSYGDALEDTIRGGLIGAAGGALISELSDNHDARYTIPFFASIGALTGYATHDNRHHDARRHGCYLPYLALPYGWHHYRPSANRRYHHREKPTIRKQPSLKTKPINRHPGITRITIPITLKNGTVLPIHLFKVGVHYTGPQGETYDSRPDAAVLQQRYSP